MKKDINIVEDTNVEKKASTNKTVAKKVGSKEASPKPKKTVSEKKISNKKKVAKKSTVKKIEAQEESTSSAEDQKKPGFFSRFIGNISDNVREGATFVGGKVAETSAKAYVTGTEIVHDTSEKIHDFTEKQSLHKEEDKIEERQNTLTLAFGQLCLTQYLETESLHKPFLTADAINGIVTEYKSNAKRMITIQKELKQ
ncbi:hypothetical protein I2486_13745 [Cellulophaga sp. E16_2]|uniref:hypothetical protein n=1 Tax=Cellulophaga sp. E16_2 TaxID=2789297 RepID=UPI001A934BC1|nr:hypothetical protein [Cellulophaga sp. E16_2]MBO0592465.1 hypothetical protein [Cellulophaga sp. E16_2]